MTTGFISGISILFHCSIFLFLCQYHTVLMTVVATLLNSTDLYPSRNKWFHTFSSLRESDLSMGRPPSPLTLPRLLPGKYEGVWSVDRTKGDVFLEIFFFFILVIENYGVLHVLACHSCSGAKLIFSVSFFGAFCNFFFFFWEYFCPGWLNPGCRSRRYGWLIVLYMLQENVLCPFYS